MHPIPAVLRRAVEDRRQRWLFGMAAVAVAIAGMLGLAPGASAEKVASVGAPTGTSLGPESATPAPRGRRIAPLGRCSDCGEIVAVQVSGQATGRVQLTLRMDDGANRHLRADDSGRWRPGQRVTLINLGEAAQDAPDGDFSAGGPH